MNFLFSKMKLHSFKNAYSILGVGLFNALLVYPLLGLAAPPQPVISQNTLPTGGVVAAGSAAIAQSGNTLTIQQSSQNAVINWGSFNVGSQAQVNFNQPNAQSATLNRVSSVTPSIINGAIHANGQIAIVNSNGVIFGKTAQVDASAIVASTMDVSDEQFMAGGAKTFKGNPNSTAKIINRGTLTAKGANAYIALLAPEVRNEGVIIAQAINDPAIALASGSQITLSFSGNHLVQVKVDASSYKSLIDNKRLIQAEGGTIVIAANAASNLLASVVKNTGVINASSIQNDGGSIRLVGASIQQSGQLLANSEQANAGTISLSGQSIALSQESLTQAIGKNSSGAIVLNGMDQSLITIAGKTQTTGATLINVPSQVAPNNLNLPAQLLAGVVNLQNYLSSLSLSNVVNEGKQVIITDTGVIQSPNIISIAATTTISGVLSTQVNPLSAPSVPTIATVQAIPSVIDTSSSSPWIALFGGDMIVNGRIQAPGVYSGSQQGSGGRIQLNVQDRLLLMASGQLLANGSDGGQIILRSEQGEVSIQGLVQTNGGSGRGGTILAFGSSNTIIDAAILQADGLLLGGDIHVGIDLPNLSYRALQESNLTGSGSTQGPPILSQFTFVGNQSQLSATATDPNGFGGSLETSGHQLAIQDVKIHVTKNNVGAWLLDPTVVTISSSGTTAYGSCGSGTCSILDTSIINAINAGTSVSITASKAITQTTALSFNFNTGTPTLIYDITSGDNTGSININANITQTGTGSLTFKALTNAGKINIATNVNISINGNVVLNDSSNNIAISTTGNGILFTKVYDSYSTFNKISGTTTITFNTGVSINGYSNIDKYSDLSNATAGTYNDASGTSQTWSNTGNAGSYSPTTGQSISWTGITYSITPAPLGLSVNATYQGGAQSLNVDASTITFYGLVGTDVGKTASAVDIAHVGTVTTGGTNYVSGITPTGWSLNNYVFNASATATGTAKGTVSASSPYTNTGGTNSVIINKADLTITATDQSTSYGQGWNLGYAEYTTVGLVGSDKVNRVLLNSTLPVLGTVSSSLDTTPAGTYTLNASAAQGNGLSNYNIRYVAGTFTIDKVVLTLTPNAVSRE